MRKDGTVTQYDGGGTVGRVIWYKVKGGVRGVGRLVRCGWIMEWE